MTKRVKHGGKPWLFGLMTLIALFLGASIWSLLKAGKEVSRVVDRDYYNHGLLYAPVDASSAAARLGWRSQPVYRNGRLELKITDRNGSPVTGGTLTVSLEGRGVPSGMLTCGMATPGVYCVPLVPVSGTVIKAGWLFQRGSDSMSGRMTVMP